MFSATDWKESFLSKQEKVSESFNKAKLWTAHQLQILLETLFFKKNMKRLIMIDQRYFGMFNRPVTWTIAKSLDTIMRTHLDCSLDN